MTGRRRFDVGHPIEPRGVVKGDRRQPGIGKFLGLGMKQPGSRHGVCSDWRKPRSSIARAESRARSAAAGDCPRSAAPVARSAASAAAISSAEASGRLLVARQVRARAGNATGPACPCPAGNAHLPARICVATDFGRSSSSRVERLFVVRAADTPAARPLPHHAEPMRASRAAKSDAHGRSIAPTESGLGRRRSRAGISANCAARSSKARG